MKKRGSCSVTPNALDGPDLRHSEKESRLLRLGRAATGRVLVVAYTVRRRGDGESVRIISARRASREERRSVRRRRGIDFSDIPEAFPAQLRVMRRVGRPPLGAAARRLIATRIDPQVLDAVRREARRRGLSSLGVKRLVATRPNGRVTVRVLSGNQRQWAPTRPKGRETEGAYNRGVGPRTLGGVAPGSDLLSRGSGVRFPPGAPLFSRTSGVRFSDPVTELFERDTDR